MTPPKDYTQVATTQLSDHGTLGRDIKPYSFWCSWRFLMLVMFFWAAFNLYALRANISVAMVCMVNNTAVKQLSLRAADVNNNTELSLANGNITSTRQETADKCTGENANSTNSKYIEDGPYVWDKPTQGIILSSFFWGYLFTQIPGGWLAYRFGSKWLIGVTLIVTAVLSMLTPMVSQLGYVAVTVVRVLQGLLGGVYFPAFNRLYARWSIPTERSRFFSFSITGLVTASILVNPISGILCATVGWESIFYVFGGLTILWGGLWIWLVTDDPYTHRYISDDEKSFIVNGLAGEINFQQEQQEKTKIPIKAILTSVPLWAAISGHTGATWGLYMMLTNLPTFMRELLHLDIKSNGLYSALPYLTLAVVMMTSGMLADTIIVEQWLSKVNVRRLMNTIALVTPAVFLVGMGYTQCGQVTLAIALLTIGNALFGCRTSGFGVSHTEIAPKYADIMMGISNTVATIPGIVAPVLIGAITTEQSPSQWQTVFWISMGVQLTGALLYAIFISADVQPWAKVDYYSADDDMGSDQLDRGDKSDIGNDKLDMGNDKLNNGDKLDGDHQETSAPL